MAFDRRSYEETRESILAQITKGVINERHVYNPARTRYRLSNPPVESIVKIEGVREGVGIIFIEATDYRLVNETVEWLPSGEPPDEQSTFYVNYTLGDLPAVSDVNPGSVIRTIIESVSREIDFMYAQMEAVYEAGFIDTASGSSLDLVASLVGVERKSAEPAMGLVTFGRNTDPGDLGVDREAQLQDGRTRYDLKRTPVKEITTVEGTHDGATHQFESGIDYILTDDSLIWLGGGSKPDINTTFYIDYIAYEQIQIPLGSVVSTYARRPDDIKTFETIEPRILQKTDEGRWESQVPVKAVEPGRAGNVFAGTVVVMPQPLVGVEYVINRGDILTGVDVESDDDVRNRARHALEVAGKATMASMESAINGIEGVSSIRVQDMPDKVKGVVRVIVQGGDRDQIQAVIDNTRAAGILVEFLRPKIVNIDVNATLLLSRGVNSSRAIREAEAQIRSYISGLDIGDQVIYHRVVNSSLNVEGVYDVEALSLSVLREGAEDVETDIEENISISPEELAMSREVNIAVRTMDERGV